MPFKLFKLYKFLYNLNNLNGKYLYFLKFKYVNNLNGLNGKYSNLIELFKLFKYWIIELTSGLLLPQTWWVYLESVLLQTYMECEDVLLIFSTTSGCQINPKGSALIYTERYAYNIYIYIYTLLYIYIWIWGPACPKLESLARSPIRLHSSCPPRASTTPVRATA